MMIPEKPWTAAIASRSTNAVSGVANRIRNAPPVTIAVATIRAGPTPSRRPKAAADAAPASTPMLPIENAIPMASGFRPSSRTRKTSRIE